MADKKTFLSSSPIFGALNNIVPIRRTSSTMRNTQSSFQGFLNFMDVEVKNLEGIKLPKKRKLNELANINVASTFGKPGNLLSSLASGALDAAGLIGNMFGGGKGSKSAKPPKVVPSKGPMVKLGGVKALGVLNAVFAGLDIAQGLSEGESAGKAATGAGGALAGSIVGAALGSVGGPLGAIAGSMAGNFLGGFMADRGYEAATGENKSIKQKTDERLKAQEQKQKALAAAAGSQLTLPEVLNKFENVVINFERSIQNIASGTSTETSQWEMGETAEDNVNYRPDDAEEFVPTGTGDGKEVFPLVGGRPNLTSEKDGGGFNSPRTGRKHNGQDIGVDPNTPVVSSRSGKVIDIYPTYGSVGSAVIIKYDNGQQGLYGHVDPSVKKGDIVQSGQRIAKVTPDGGNTHLHYMRKDTKGNYIDPAPILRGSKSGPPLAKVEPKKEKPTIGKDTGDSMESQQKPQTQNLSQMSTDNLKGMLDPTKTGASNPAVFQAASKAREDAKMQGLSEEDLERQVLIASIQASRNIPMVNSVPLMNQLIPMQIQQYPDYNQPQSSVTIIPMMIDSGGSGGSQRPMVISSGGGGTVIMPPAHQGVLLNSLFKTMLLTNLSAM
jgi:murein DD-endopeptidase MepM/ murein hydrolase activator NlpD